MKTKASRTLSVRLGRMKVSLTRARYCEVPYRQTRLVVTFTTSPLKDPLAALIRANEMVGRETVNQEEGKCW